MNLFFRRCNAVAVLILATVSSGHAAADSLSLVDAVELAARDSPDVAAREAAVDAAQSLLIPSGELPDPELVFGVDNLSVTGRDAGSLTNDFMTMRKVGVMQSIPRASKRALRVERATDAMQLAHAERTRTALEVKRETANAWISVYAAEATLHRLREIEPHLELQLKIATSGVSTGRLPTTEVLDAKAALIGYQDRIHLAEQNVRHARAELARWLPEDAQRPLSDPPDFSGAMPARLIQNVHHHASLIAFDTRLDAARTDIALAQADKHADWSIGVTYAQRGPLYSNMVSMEFRVGLPLFSSRRQDPVIASKRAELRGIEAQRDSELRMHRSELGQTIADWETLQARIELYNNELLPLAHQRTQLALSSVPSGAAGIKPVLQAQTAEVDAQLQAIDLHAQLGHAWAYLTYLQDAGEHP